MGNVSVFFLTFSVAFNIKFWRGLKMSHHERQRQLLIKSLQKLSTIANEIFPISCALHIGAAVLNRNFFSFIK